MDVGRILTRAWQITWRWKVLWILGFLAALAQGTGGPNASYSFSNGDFQNGRWSGFDFPAAAGALIVGLACLAIIVAIALCMFPWLPCH
jgi:hypothetical protein